MATRRLDGGVIIALIWGLSAIAITALIGAQLGLRGWVWLGLHHLLCVAGVSHELSRGWKRRKQRTTETP